MTKIIVHGGAGPWPLDSNRLAQAVKACERAAAAGQGILLGGGTALKAVEEAVRVLEDDPALDAGRGSNPNRAGQIEMDALIMDGSSLQLGAVAAVQRIRNPITLARLVMTDCEHNFMVGPGAETFAESVGLERCSLEDLLYLWPGSQASLPNKTAADPEHRKGIVSDTVGAAAIDIAGNLAAGTSTGGIRNKLPGRVGDSPLVGSGAYADNSTAAVSATGDGEVLMKIVISKLVSDYVATGLAAQEACDAAIRYLEARVSGQGGVIAVDHHAHLGWSFNTNAMPYAFAEGNQAIVSGHDHQRLN